MSQIVPAKKSHSWLMKGALALFVLIFALVLGLNAFKSYKTNQYLSHMPEPINPVTAITLTPQIWTPVLDATGVVRANQGAMLKAQTSGVVAQILVKAGQQVKKGDVLVVLDDGVEKANLAVSEAKLASVRQTYQSYVKLFRSHSVSKQELDNAKASLDSLQANIDALKASLSRRQIVAPFSGTTGIVKVNVGQFVNAGGDVLRLEDRSQMKVDFAIAQNNLAKLHLGQTIVATTDAYPNQEFSGEISAIDPAIDASSGLIDVQATFAPKNEQLLLAGMFTALRLHLPTEEKQFVVPQVAINFNMYGDFIYVLTPLSAEEKANLLKNPHFLYKEQMDNLYRAKQLPIEVKDRRNVNAQLINQDLKFGEKIVVGGMQALGKNSLVIVKDKPLIGTTVPTLSSHL